MKEQLHLYTIVPLDTEHLEEWCEDIRAQYEKGVSSCALFSMTLVPEGNPPVDKVGILCQKYDLFKEKLDSMGIPNGILVQATIGHGWVLGEMFPYQRYTNFNDGTMTNTVCPYDKGFQEYIYHVMQTIASHRPACIMVDDDFRLMFRDGEGCACPLHMQRFCELSGTTLTREELWKTVTAGTEIGKRYADLMVKIQLESLTETAKIMRAGIDSVDPSMPATFCCVGSNAECAYENAAILAGAGNPVVVRINNGNYTAAGARFFSEAFSRAASQIAKLYGKVDVILAETDTCPQNRYSTGAMSLHTHFTGSILEGAKGAKHWISRMDTYEPESGKAYRKILEKYRDFYEALAVLVPSLTWKGFRIPASDTPMYVFGKKETAQDNYINAWSACVLERLGLPLYFSAKTGGVTCLEGDNDQKFTDEQILEMLKGSVFLASDSAKSLIKRGFGKYIGVDVQEWQGKQPTGELLFVNGNTTTVQQKVKALIPTAPDVIQDSSVYHCVDGEHYDTLFPGTTIYRNELGGMVFVFSGTPRCKYNLVEAFSFLTYSRKQQLIRMLAMAEELPVYYPNDEEVYLKAAQVRDGGIFCAVFNLGMDPIEKLELVCQEEVFRADKLMSDGSWEQIGFTANQDRVILDVPCNTLDPVILILNRDIQV